MLSPPMNAMLAHGIRTRVGEFNPVRNTSTRPSRGLMRDFETSSGLKLPFAGFNARTRPGGFLALHSYRPCLGLLPPMPEAVFATPRSWSFGHRARWSRNAWRPRPRRGRAATGFAFRSWSSSRASARHRSDIIFGREVGAHPHGLCPDRK